MLGGHGTLKKCLGLFHEPGRGGNCSGEKSVGFDTGYLLVLEIMTSVGVRSTSTSTRTYHVCL